MLKSHFNLQRGDDEEEEQLPEKEQDQPERTIDEQGLVGEGPGSDSDVPGSRKYPEIKLSKSVIAVNLSLLGKTADGDGYTYLKVVVTGMSLTNIVAIKHFRHLQFVDVSRNNLDLESLQVVTELPYLLYIQADFNRLNSAALKKTKYLQVMIFNNNNIKSVENIFQPELSSLELGFNKVRNIQFINRMSNIRCLDFRYNLITDLSNLDFPLLDSLFLAGNKIKSLVGLDSLTNLRILNLRYNPIKSLDGFGPGMTKLQYINLRNCKVSSLTQIKKLRVLPALESIVLKGCPYMGGTGKEDAEVPQEDDPETRIEVLAALQRLKRLNKGEFNSEERSQAKELMMQWIEEGEKSDEEDIEEEERIGDEFLGEEEK